jgi:broad-specificity NMP kinase
VVDELEPLINAGGGLILDWHTCDAFPERWIDLVVVLQCNHTRLWERLEARCVVTIVIPAASLITECIDLPYLEVTH